MRIVHEWLAELVDVPADVETVAREISLRGFEVAAVESGVIDFEITANRPDCLSHAGIAREASVIWPQPARAGRGAELSGRVVAPGSPPVTIEAPDLCPRYSARLFDVVVGPSPARLARRLEAAGIRSINNVVDITNYVMLQMGQPMHAFDLERLAGGQLVVRRARPGETLRTLDGLDRALDVEMLVIADAERAVAVGGVMGGQGSEISESTTKMVLESAYFQPASVRRTSRRLNLKTEASIRFERGADVGATSAALEHATQLLEQIGAARVLGMVDVYPAPKAPVQLKLRGERIARVLGLTVPPADVARILGGLGFTATADGDNRWAIVVPGFRPDVTREIDLVEEVGRHYGFDRLPATFPVLAAAQVPPDPGIERDRRARAVLTASGVSESMTFAFIEHAAAAPFCAPGSEPAAIANPLSEKFAVLRPSLLPGLVDSSAHNRRRGRKDVRLFESGSRFTPAGEGRAVAVAWSGAGNAAHWSAPPRTVDFFDVKGVVEMLCSAFGVDDLKFATAETSYLVGGRAAAVRSGDVTLGVLGQLLPSIAEARGFPAGEELYVAELDLDALAPRGTDRELRAETLPKFPPIVRDLSILVGEALPAAAVRGTIRSAAPAFLQSIVEFDRYQGKGIPEARVSLSLRLTFRSQDRTLTDDEVDAAMHTIVGALEREHGAHRR
ncbi:MAG TPA: phenylalanine--tRNA ligase subunit beta [Vicinamibacterales bacterium]|nr:phenylalanine--tRNA ligase subunit beta [Vicinamibacterales bacterium]